MKDQIKRVHLVKAGAVFERRHLLGIKVRMGFLKHFDRTRADVDPVEVRGLEPEALKDWQLSPCWAADVKDLGSGFVQSWKAFWFKIPLSEVHEEIIIFFVGIKLIEFPPQQTNNSLSSNIKFTWCSADGLVVSVLALYTNTASSSPAEVYRSFFEMLFEKWTFELKRLFGKRFK